MARATVSLFVYGTLKRGHSAHGHFFGGEAGVEEASVRGSLFALPAGYPALSVPTKDVSATGTSDPLSDAKVQSEAAASARVAPACGGTVHGEILRFDAPELRLPALDEYEGFDPEVFGPDAPSLYLRVLIPAWTSSGRSSLVWTYIMESPSGVRIPGGRWSP